MTQEEPIRRPGAPKPSGGPTVELPFSMSKVEGSDASTKVQLAAEFLEIVREGLMNVTARAIELVSSGQMEADAALLLVQQATSNAADQIANRREQLDA